MLNVLRMPQMGVSDESAILSKWLVREGDHVRKGQPVFSLETDKATFQHEAESDGVLVRILTGEGEEVAVGSPVGIMSESETFDKSELKTLLRELKTPDERHPAQTEAKNDILREEHLDFEHEHVSIQNTPDGKRKVSPRARKKADVLGVDVNSIYSGSGPDGRVIERDVLSVQTNRKNKGVELKICDIWAGRPLTVENRISMRQVCAEEAGRTGFVSRMFDASKIIEFCKTQNEITPGTAICHELARLLVKMPELNARRHGDKIYEYNTVHLRLNVETRFGTLKPVIRCAEAYTSNELDVLMRSAAERCKRFASKPQEFQDGTFTVADLSEYVVDSFTPELTPPELCALGIGAAATQTRLDKRGRIEVYPAIRLTLVYDRVGVDLLSAARFLNELAFRLEPDGTQN